MGERLTVGWMRAALAMPVVALLAAAGQPPIAARLIAGARALGYAAEIERACPDWRRVPATTLVRRGLLDRETPIEALAYDGPLHDAYWSGLGTAQRDRALHPAFCVDPARLRPNLPIAQTIDRAR